MSVTDCGETTGTSPAAPWFLAEAPIPSEPAGRYGQCGTSESRRQVHIGGILPWWNEVGVNTRVLLEVPTGKQWDRVGERIQELSELHSGWNGRGSPAPSSRAIRAARLVFDRLKRQELEPARINPSASGGLIFYFFGPAVTDGGSHARVASIDCHNSGEIVQTRIDRLGSAPASVEVVPVDSIADVLLEIARFVDATSTD